MTFTEAAVEVLKREGKPLHFRKIAEIAIRESLLDHVGKIPEDTMADQLSAHCKLPRPDRAIVAVQHATFALEEWGLPEDPVGLENLIEPPPADEPPYRPKERHPIPARELARSTGREAGRGRRRDEEGDEKRRRFPPPAEVAYEILSGAERPLPLRELAALGAERMLMPEAFVRDAGSLAAALREDNRRRESAGRKALFAIEGDVVSLGAVPEPGERPAPVIAVRIPSTPVEMRRAALVALRRRLRECDGPTVEYLVARLLEKTGLHEVKVAKRGRDSVVLTGRRRMGLVDVRHAIRVLRNGADVGRRDVTEVRRDLGHYGAQIGVLVTSGEAQREARGEAAAAGQMPVLLVAGEAFAEAFADAGFACRTVSIPEADEEFLQQATETAQREEVARKARREERDRREGREGRDVREDRDGREDRDRGRREERRPRPPDGGAPEVPGDAPGAVVADETAPEPTRLPAFAPDAPAVAVAPNPEPLDDVDDDGEDDGEGEEGPETPGAENPGEPGKDAGPAGEGRRRRRRRRRRGGRGRGERRAEGEGAAPGSAVGESPGSASGSSPGGAAETQRAAPPSPPADPGGSGPPPASGGGEGA